MSLELRVEITVTDTASGTDYITAGRHETVMPATPDGDDSPGHLELARAALTRLAGEAQDTVQEQLGQLRELLAVEAAE